MNSIDRTNPPCSGAGIRGTRSRRPAGFTLVELLVVIAIIGTLMALLLPAVQSARESGRRVTCSSRLAELAKAAMAHTSLIGHLPTGGWNQNWIGDPSKGSDYRQPGGWCFVILPYIEEQNTFDLAATDPSGFVSKNVPTFTCPTRRGSGLLAASSSASKNGGAVNLAGAPQWMRTDFAGNRGAWASSPASPTATDVMNRATTFGFVGGVTAPSAYPANDPESLRNFQTGTIAPVVATLNAVQAAPGSPALNVSTGGVIFLGSAVPPASIRDGASNTYVFGEKYLPVAVYAAGDAVGNDQCAYVGDSSSTLRGGQRPPESDVAPMTAVLEGVFGGPHPGGFNAAMCDGSVRNVAYDIDARVHFFLSARADRQPVPPQ